MQKRHCYNYESCFCSSLVFFYVIFYSARLLAHLYIFMHFLTTVLLQSQVLKKAQLLLTSSFPSSLSSVLSNSLLFSLICPTFVYKQIFFLLFCSKIIIAVSWHYHQSPCHYQSIETLPADSMSLSEYSHIISTVSMPLSEYRHIISRSPWRYQSIATLSAQSPPHYQIIVTSCEVSCRHIVIILHAIIRLSSHYHQSPCHYQSIFTLSAVSTLLSEYHNIITKSPCHYQRTVTSSEVFMLLPEYRYIISSFSMSLSWYCHIISRLRVFIRVSSHYQQTPRLC